MEELELDTYDPILYMRTLGLLDQGVPMSKYTEFIAKMKKKLVSVDSRIAEYVEKQSRSFILLSEKITVLDTLANDLKSTDDKFNEYITSGLDKNRDLFVRIK